MVSPAPTPMPCSCPPPSDLDARSSPLAANGEDTARMRSGVLPVLRRTMYTGTSLTFAGGSRVQGWMNSKSLILASWARPALAATTTPTANAAAALSRFDMTVCFRDFPLQRAGVLASEGKRHARDDAP